MVPYRKKLDTLLQRFCERGYVHNCKYSDRSMEISIFLTYMKGTEPTLPELYQTLLPRYEYYIYLFIYLPLIIQHFIASHFWK